MEAKFTQRIRETQDQQAMTTSEYQQKVKQLEREKQQLSERLELASRDQQSEFTNLQKRHEKLSDQLERLQ
jgi:predicted nuclease with TOPRIM domain